MRIEHHPEAYLELIEASSFYEQRSEGLGEALIEAVEAAVLRIRDDPLLFPVTYRDRRRCPVNRFPYSVFYRLIGDTIRVLGIRHHRQEPESWTHRE